MKMQTLLKAQREQLITNHNENLRIRCDGDGNTIDFKPVVKLFVCVGGNATWLLTEMDPDTGVAFGLCDLGHGTPELGYVSIPQLQTELDWRLERDKWFTADKPLSVYGAEARDARYITA